MLKTITWQQVALTAVLLSATVAAYKLLGENAAAAMASITTVVTFLLGRPTEKSEAP